jgi:hypothetical protein
MKKVALLKEAEPGMRLWGDQYEMTTLICDRYTKGRYKESKENVEGKEGR